MNEREKRLLVAHRFICSLLDLRREKGFWITGGKTWDCIKWNYGAVSISRRAVQEWFARPELSSYRFPAERLGGRRGYKDGPGLKGNISRLCVKPDMRERIAELAAAAGEKAGIEDAWVLSRIKVLAYSTLANFVRCEGDKLVLDERGFPIIDLSNATPEQFRTLAVLENDQSERLKLELRDPIPALKLLAKNRGLLRHKLPPINAGGEGPARVYLVSDKPMSEEEWKGLFVREG